MRHVIIDLPLLMLWIYWPAILIGLFRVRKQLSTVRFEKFVGAFRHFWRIFLERKFLHAISLHKVFSEVSDGPTEHVMFPCLGIFGIPQVEYQVLSLAILRACDDGIRGYVSFHVVARC